MPTDLNTGDPEQVYTVAEVDALLQAIRDAYS